MQAWLTVAPQGVKHVRQGSIWVSRPRRQASHARAPAHADRMAPPRVPSRMGQATATARPARGSSPAAIPQVSRLPSRHLTNLTTTMSQSTNAHQQVVRHEGNWQDSRGDSTFRLTIGRRCTPPRQGSWRWCLPRIFIMVAHVRGLRLYGEWRGQ